MVAATGRAGFGSADRVHLLRPFPTTTLFHPLLYEKKERSREKKRRSGDKSVADDRESHSGASESVSRGRAHRIPDLMGTGYLPPELATQERRLVLRCRRLDTSGGGATPTRASPRLYIIHHHTNPGHQVAIPGEKDSFRLSVWKRCWSHKQNYLNYYSASLNSPSVYPNM